MILPINDSYRLAADQHGWSVQRVRVRKDRTTGEPVSEWESFLWYADAQRAAQGLGQYMLRTSDVQTLADALLEVDRIATRLSQALTPKIKTGEVNA